MYEYDVFVGRWAFKRQDEKATTLPPQMASLGDREIHCALYYDFWRPILWQIGWYGENTSI